MLDYDDIAGHSNQLGSASLAKPCSIQRNDRLPSGGGQWIMLDGNLEMAGVPLRKAGTRDVSVFYFGVVDLAKDPPKSKSQGALASSTTLETPNPLLDEALAMCPELYLEFAVQTELFN